MLNEFTVSTGNHNEMIDITHEIQNIVQKSGIMDGICTVHVPHTTAGVTVNENADPDVRRDIIHALNQIVPANMGFHHGEGNSDAHVKTSLMGMTRPLIIQKGQLVLGTWQSVFFCEFDGPRRRKVYVHVQ